LDRYHPDKNASNPEASELFKEVTYSYSILSDPEKRRQYDSAGFEVLFCSCLSGSVSVSVILHYIFNAKCLVLHVVKNDTG
jgi:curved DNA-binding protein CbpA